MLYCNLYHNIHFKCFSTCTYYAVMQSFLSLPYINTQKEKVGRFSRWMLKCFGWKNFCNLLQRADCHLIHQCHSCCHRNLLKFYFPIMTLSFHPGVNLFPALNRFKKSLQISENWMNMYKNNLQIHVCIDLWSNTTVRIVYCINFKSLINYDYRR